MIHLPGWRNIPSARTLSIMIFFAGIGLIVSVVFLLYLSQHLIGQKANEIDKHRSVLSVNGAVQTSVNRVLSLVLDNSVWDDAVSQTYAGRLDPQWLYNSWGSGFKINNLYDGTFVLDQHYRVLWGSFRSQPFPGQDTQFLGSGFHALISQHAAALRSGKSAWAGITRTRAGIAFIGIGLIRPTVGRLQVFDDTRRYLVITRHINPQMLERLGDTFQIRNLHVTQTGGEYSIPLRTQAGETVGYLSWQPGLPGAEASRAASNSIRLIAAVAAGLILLFILFSCLGLYKLARGESVARHTAMTDWLSRLPNRRALIERLNQVCENSRYQTQSVVFIDLDGFKDVNDNYGHDVGDALILHIAKALRERVPPEGMLARMGGDEFAMTISGAEAANQASVFARAVLELLNAPIILSGRKIYISASIGIASGVPASCSSTELFRRADIAMYHSKKTGKGRTTWYDEALSDARQYQLNIENGIRQGLENEEFDVWYQPIVNADTLVMEGVEALLRWPRRPQGALPPDAFIGIAESSGLIYALGQFVLHRACSDLQPLGDLLLSVNISPAQFRDPEFESRVVQVLGRCHFPARRLQLEVTESYVLENPDRARTAIKNLKSLGIAVALDDFGTGYSSIGYLRSFSFDSLKIDKSLAGLVDVDTQAAELVRGTVRIAGALDITVVAEGVENQKQLALLRRAGCDRLQGYYFSEPMPVTSLLQLRQQQG
ncbi:putative bifunctional diguanylate cyclase/phosphodiesterase [Klebsiella oxytoca]|uniref:Bifunctional diguanylate cyclase/phosphodiesterase n=1 Tax=Klebsiella oxytoca TaxID=571 RepID=A0AAP2FLJ4_KLEOX|nr:bifunctional diguanylate cyclase/phosphodiesterase [Klebsiella oxytoca]EJB5613756.1 bifunctional diguanylate cyclase/phosphodiesterase [Klebsiella oxytoca]EJM1007450.1 bifunctional diguanylate cyclase/phosphodiesterase [Klebsiella oxytoca]EJZ8386367.1 bifunctional diguanylate cyclase/phosphodiesterase [Klebsiella oxytoca]EKQ7241953.1 bifunctional diguanylate cyclase/phosphodiesterase [Klebsiella oxytoca]EKW7111682.1 bifunctional diguanylate cyclase/phosphodiesterase [Klebsiella oxytoca]